MKHPAVIALDLGGTKLAGAVFGPNGRIAHRSVVPLEGRAGREVSELICGQFAGLRDAARTNHRTVVSVGISVPGISRSRTGTVWAPNIPRWEDYPLRRELRAAIGDKGIPLTIESDRACYIMGETWRGVAQGCRNAIFVAVGTGIGAGIMVEGQVLRGAHDIAGAIGWLALDRPYQRKYVGCGCFEYHASGQGLARVAREQGLDCTSAREVFAALKRRNPTARKVVAQAVEFWGMAVANLVSLFNPEKIIFGGGVFGPGTEFLDDIYREARKWAQPVSIKQVKLQASSLGSDAGLYGAAALALQARR